MSPKRQRCKLPICEKLTVSKCEKCDIHLCLTLERNCLKYMHIINTKG